MSSERVQAKSHATSPIEAGKQPPPVVELGTASSSGIANANANTTATNSNLNGKQKTGFVFGRPRQQPSLQEEGFRLSILHSLDTIKPNNSNLQAPEINVFAQPLFRTKHTAKRLSFKDFQTDSDFSASWEQQQHGESGGADFAQERTSSGGAKTQNLFAFQTISNNHNDNSIPIPEKLPEISLISREEENIFFSSSSDLHLDDSSQDNSKADLQSSQTGIQPQTIYRDEPFLSSSSSHVVMQDTFSDSNMASYDSESLYPLETHNIIDNSNVESNNRIEDTKQIQMNENKSNEDEFGIIMDAVKKWRSEVKRRDTEINKLSDTIEYLRKDLLRRDETMKLYHERIKCVEGLIKRQFTDTDRSRQRIGGIKSRYITYRNTLLSMGKNIQEIHDEKERIDEEVEHMKQGKILVTTKLDNITKETNASLIGTQRVELEQLREYNSKLTQDNVQANETISKLREDLQQSILNASSGASEFEASCVQIKTLTREYDLLKSNHTEEVQKLKLAVERAENNLQVESDAKKECEEKINVLTVKIHQHELNLESMHRENERLNAVTTEKENRILSLKSIEVQRKSLQAELDHVKKNTNKQIDDLYQEIENLRTHQKAERQRLENEGREEICRLQEDFQKKRTIWEQKWNNENARLESECREEREQRSKLESRFHEKCSENLRLEAELRNSQYQPNISTFSRRIEDLEKQLCQYDYPKIESFSIGVGTADIPEIDVLIQHERFIAESNQELTTTKSKITELNQALETTVSECKSIESELSSITASYNKLLEEHNKLISGTSNTEIQKKNAVDQALNRAQLYYQDLAKRATVQHENEIRKRDYKLREAEIRESTLSEEIRSLRSRLLQAESKEGASTHQMLPNTEIKSDVQLIKEQKTNKQTQSRCSSIVSPSLHSSSNTTGDTEPSLFGRLPIMNKHESTDNACSKYLTLSEIDSMVIDSIEQKNPSITETKVEESQMTIKRDMEDSIGIGSSQDHSSGRVVPSLNDNTTKHNQKNDSFNEWQSPGTQLRAKRRKISRIDSKDNLQPSSSLDKSSAAPTNIGDSNRPSTKTSLRQNNIFQDTLDQQDFQNRLQSIKTAFFNRDYNAVFTDPENLSIYSARYIPGRALCYFNLIKNETKILELFGNNNNGETRVFSVGSGAGSELVGFVSALHHHQISTDNTFKDDDNTQGKLILHMQDYVDWGKVLNNLELTIREQWNISHKKLECLFSVGDVLEPTRKLQEQFAKADLITFMFVMNELFIDKKKAIEMIQLLVNTMQKGSHLLVLDSAGSFSNIKIGEKTYMIYFLLDALKGFTPVISNDSTWYRYPEGLKYHELAPLENMRYYIRLYRKD
ncbi:10082_t:CDS:10 [Ambispora gerdemannii]|uniref:10082_t:CDS:1 n=1 Tax=Ambispora gerdemannii TaxID=144530 RepID=A0A9N8WBL1_9GLOM|nr:10082_t:CDS:10 [Ambispora gerdemannii]